MSTITRTSSDTKKSSSVQDKAKMQVIVCVLYQVSSWRDAGNAVELARRSILATVERSKPNGPT